MKVTVEVIVESDEGQVQSVTAVSRMQREDLEPATLGLTLAEAKDLLAGVQGVMVTHQAAQYVEQQRLCPHCGASRSCKGQHEIVFRTLFGQLRLPSPRLYTCSCQGEHQRSFSPLADRLPDRTAPELIYLQTRWAALMSYGLTTGLLEEVLPIQVSRSRVFQLRDVAERLEGSWERSSGPSSRGAPQSGASFPIPTGH